MYKSPEDQYLIPQAGKMIESLKPKCKGSTVIVKETVFINSIAHSGSISHSCYLKEGHEGSCECSCGKLFTLSGRL